MTPVENARSKIRSLVRRKEFEPDGWMLTALRWLASRWDQQWLDWANANVSGAGVVTEGDQAHLEIYLREALPDGFDRFLRRYLPKVVFVYKVTGPFQLLVGAGEEIEGGTVGAILRDPAGNRYALTCAHVLTKNLGSPVKSGSTVIGTLSHRVELVALPPVNPASRDPREPNSVDCALARLAAPLTASVGKPAVPLRQGDSFSLGGRLAGTKGTVRSHQADIRCDLTRGGQITPFYFDDVVIGTISSEARPGDSGSPVSTAAGPAGIVFAAGPLNRVGQGARLVEEEHANLAICDLTKVIAALQKTDPVLSGLLTV